MNRILLLFLCAFYVSSISGQFDRESTEYFVGSGTDTTFLIIDFKDNTFDSAFVWGYLYSGSKTGEDLLNAVAAADINLQINIDSASFGNFLQDIAYINHEGLGGAPDFWSTWEGPDLAGLASNSGIASPLLPGGILGVSYTDFNPAIAPGTPLPAYDPNDLSFDMITSWFGTGSDSLVMIIDFSDSTDTTSYAWGYLFNDSISYLSVLSDLDQADSALSISISGAVGSISYRGLTGMVGALADWYVWEAENFGNWRLRYVDNVYLHPGDFGAVVYTRFIQPVRPVLPVNIDQTIGIPYFAQPSLEIYPNPADDFLNIDGIFSSYQLYSSAGSLVLRGHNSRIALAHLNTGLYLLKINFEDGHAEIRSLIVR